MQNIYFNWCRNKLWVKERTFIKETLISIQILFRNIISKASFLVSNYRYPFSPLRYQNFCFNVFRQLILGRGTLINCLLKNIIHLSNIILSISIFSTFVTNSFYPKLDKRTFIIRSINFAKNFQNSIQDIFIYLVPLIRKYLSFSYYFKTVHFNKSSIRYKNIFPNSSEFFYAPSWKAFTFSFNSFNSSSIKERSPFTYTLHTKY